MNNCIFCDNPDVMARSVVREELVWAFPTNIPIVPGHVLIAPVRHVSIVDELSDAEWSAIKNSIQRLKVVLTKLYGAEGYNVAWNEGELAGQSVPHMHVHLLPRKTGDTGITEYEPRKFLYRTGSREITPEAELAVI